MGKATTNEMWNCPFCSYRVEYGKHCPDIEASPDRDSKLADSCERGVKNIIYATQKRNTAREAEKGIGISEIANEDM